MAAALRLEFVLRVVNNDKTIQLICDGAGSDGNKQARMAKASRNATKGTYGQVVRRFLSLHEGTVAPDLVTYLEDSIEFRNCLAHTFFQSHVPNFMNEVGLSLIKKECDHFTMYFVELEKTIVECSNVDFDLFVRNMVERRAKGPPHPMATPQLEG